MHRLKGRDVALGGRLAGEQPGRSRGAVLSRSGRSRAAYSAAVLPGALVVGARSLAILGNLLDYQRLSSSARLSSRQHGRLLVSLSRHSIGRARMQARNCRESEVGPPRLSIHSRASRAPLLLLQPLGGKCSLARPAGSRPLLEDDQRVSRSVPESRWGSGRRRRPGELQVCDGHRHHKVSR